MKGWIVLITVLCPVSLGLQWTEDLSDGVFVHACKGGNLTLPWNVTLGQGESIDDIKWFYKGGSQEEMIAMFSRGNFFAMPAFSQRVTYLGNAGIELNHVTTSDAGNYSVEVVAHEAPDEAGKLSTFHRYAIVDIATDPPVSSDGSLHVRQEPVAVYDQSSDEWKVALTCGTLTSRGHPPVDVTWTTPSGAEVPSTSYANGDFRLLLTNPVSGGTYTCHLPQHSPAATCLPRDSPLLTSASVDVDKMDARISLLEVQQKLLQEKNERLEAENTALKNNFTNYSHGLESTIYNRVSDLERNVTDRLNQLSEKTNRHVSFHAQLAHNEVVNVNDVIVLPSVISNDGGAYNRSTGVFTAPLDGTYVFMATASSPDLSYASLQISVEGRTVSNLASNGNANNMGSCHAVVHLQRGQQVSLRSWASNAHYYSSTTTFSGFLINAD